MCGRACVCVFLASLGVPGQKEGRSPARWREVGGRLSALPLPFLGGERFTTCPLCPDVDTESQPHLLVQGG